MSPLLTRRKWESWAILRQIIELQFCESVVSPIFIIPSMICMWTNANCKCVHALSCKGAHEIPWANMHVCFQKTKCILHVLTYMYAQVCLFQSCTWALVLWGLLNSVPLGCWTKLAEVWSFLPRNVLPFTCSISILLECRCNNRK